MVPRANPSHAPSLAAFITTTPELKFAVHTGLLYRRENASVIEQGCACLSPGSAIRRHKFARDIGRTSSSIRSDLDFRYTQVCQFGHRGCAAFGGHLATERFFRSDLTTM